MKKLSLVRLGSYAAIIGIALLLHRQLRVIPVLLLGDTEVATFESEPERKTADRALVSSASFRDSKLSGSDVIEIAQKKAREAGQDLDRFIVPIIALRVVEERLHWVVAYRAALGPFQFEVWIEDSTGIASYVDTTAPL